MNIPTPEPAAAGPVQEPTLESIDNDDIFTKFYDWIYSIFE